MALNMLIMSIVLSNGYISTCLQYVHRVKSFLMVNIFVQIMPILLINRDSFLFINNQML